ncbi:hypothetical protein FOCC_FOCC005457 [Frankliniella occidentalis]|nr:hypothetical protein FOCC_FOCC005457 [Frankliniella occidentalis]
MFETIALLDPFRDAWGSDPLAVPVELPPAAPGAPGGPAGNRDAQPTLCECGRWFRYRSSLYRHLKYECGKEPRFRCHLCHFRTKRELSLRRHIETRHSDDATQRAPILYPPASQPTPTRRAAIGRVSGSGPVSCERCGRVYRAPSSLYTHRRYECGKPPRFQCPACPHRAHQRSNIKKHVRKRHPDVWNRVWFEASVWEAMDVEPSAAGGEDADEPEIAEDDQGAVRPSLQSRSRRREFACEDCGKLYNYVSSFNRHRKFECGKEPGFLCALCPYRGKRKSRLVEHIKIVHSSWDGTPGGRRGAAPLRYVLGIVQNVFQVKINLIKFSLRLYHDLPNLPPPPDETWHIITPMGLFDTVFVMDKGPPPLRPLSPPRQGQPPTTGKRLAMMGIQLQLQQQQQQQQPLQGSFVCPQCGKAYHHDQSLWRHRKFECGKAGTFQCPYCDHRSRRRAHLADHETLSSLTLNIISSLFIHCMALAHVFFALTGQPREPSPLDPRMWPPQGFLGAVGNRDQMPSRCDGCGRSYAYRSSLYRHLKYECGKLPQFQCPYCPRKTKQKLNLKEHIRMIHPGEPNPFDFPLLK